MQCIIDRQVCAATSHSAPRRSSLRESAKADGHRRRTMRTLLSLLGYPTATQYDFPVGYVANDGTAGSRLSHGWALLTKMLASGRNQLGSSNVQTRTPTTSSRVDTCTYRGAPHSPQKARVTSFPESAFATYSLGEPRTMWNSAAGMRTEAMCGAPLWRWQSRQWH